MLRAYDKNTGKEVGAVWMPAPQSGSPMTYMANGKQYIIVVDQRRQLLGRVPRFQPAGFGDADEPARNDRFWGLGSRV